MMKKLIFACFAVAALLFQPAFAVDQAICDDQYIPDEQKEAAGCNASGEDNDPFATLSTVLNSIYAIVTITAVGVIIFGGFRYSVSQGDPGKVKKAKDTIMYAIIGLVVVLSAFAITNFILSVI